MEVGLVMPDILVDNTNIETRSPGPLFTMYVREKLCHYKGYLY